MVAANPVRVLIAEPFELTRRGITDILSAEESVRVVGDFGDVHVVPAQVSLLQPDVCLIGLSSSDEMADRNAALSAIAAIARGSEWAAIGVVTDAASIEDILEPVRAGAKAVVGRRAPTSILLAAIGALSKGEYFVGPQHARMLFEYLGQQGMGTEGDRDQRDQRLRANLTRREAEVLGELVRGYRTSEIAQHLSMSQATVKTHVRQICRKLNVRGRTEAILKALNVQAAVLSCALPF